METPEILLDAITRKYPRALREAAGFRADKGSAKDLDWIDLVYLPIAAWFAIVTHGRLFPMSVTPEESHDLAVLGAVGTWAHSRGIYRFDQDLQEELLSTPIEGDLPSDILQRLPEFAPYIETKGLEYLGDPIDGFFVYLEEDARSKQMELRISIVQEDLRLLPLIIHLGPWSLREALIRMLHVAKKNLEREGERDMHLIDDRLIGEMIDPIARLLSLILYLCSDKPEKVPTNSDRSPKRKSSRGRKVEYSPRVNRWFVGREIGNQIRAFRNGGGGSSRAPHIRRGHWHGYWTGPRDSVREFVYRWIPPTFISGSGEGDPPGRGNGRGEMMNL